VKKPFPPRRALSFFRSFAQPMPGRGLEFRFCPWAADIRKLIEHKNEELEQQELSARYG
jgi:hypothetical protein